MQPMRCDRALEGKTIVCIGLFRSIPGGTPFRTDITSEGENNVE
ncbi:MAG TPA: hypothetical protein PKW57_08070 [Anaerolineaceae bacterium]|nr:hypothetical protein [Anaerolineaceae bacterium]HPS33443.1 hypothetical protein [Anaerolineaceae bacterium]